MDDSELVITDLNIVKAEFKFINRNINDINALENGITLHSYLEIHKEEYNEIKNRYEDIKKNIGVTNPLIKLEILEINLIIKEINNMLDHLYITKILNNKQNSNNLINPNLYNKPIKINVKN